MKRYTEASKQLAEGTKYIKKKSSKQRHSNRLTCTALKCVNTLPEIYSCQASTQAVVLIHVQVAALVYASVIEWQGWSLTSPSVFVAVRDLHSNWPALSTGKPDEEQSRLGSVTTPHCLCLCYSLPQGSVNCLSGCWKGGGWSVMQCETRGVFLPSRSPSISLFNFNVYAVA